MTENKMTENKMTENKMVKCFLSWCLCPVIILGPILSAIVIGFLFISCNSSLSTWLLIYGFMMSFIFIAILICTIPCLYRILFKATSDYGSSSLLLIPAILALIMIIIFQFCWTIYGAVIFFPAVSGPYLTCQNSNDVRILIYSGTIIVIHSCIICWFPGFSVSVSAFCERKQSTQVDDSGIRTKKSHSGEFNVNCFCGWAHFTPLVTCCCCGPPDEEMDTKEHQQGGFRLKKKVYGFVGLLGLLVKLYAQG